MFASILRITEDECVKLLAFEVDLQPTTIQIAPTFIEPILNGNKKTTIRFRTQELSARASYLAL
jgi:hypothetical protein